MELALWVGVDKPFLQIGGLGWDGMRGDVGQDLCPFSWREKIMVYENGWVGDVDRF